MAAIAVNQKAAAQEDPQPAEKLTPEQTKFFESKIRPVLVRECYGCHAVKTGQTKGGLVLDTKLGWEQGGDSGEAIIPGDLDGSLLWSAINYDEYRMPPNGKLAKNVINDFKTWIEMGAPDPRILEIKNVGSKITPEDIEKGKSFWSYSKPVHPDVPKVERGEWPINDIDRFVLAKLESNQLQPAADTDALTLLRRLAFDLTGLPPTQEQIKWMQRNYKKDSDKAVAHIVDSMLANPAFGERWGRHWLDVARYAESTGKENNITYPHAWRYRDFVIDSFNDDKPYDRFIQQQIAGDLLPIKNDKDWAENLTGTTFLAMGPKSLNEQNGRQFKLDLVDEQIDVATRVVLGTSVACARCHDHKFDPIPQADYYALAGIFENMETYYGTIDTLQNRRPSRLLTLPIDSFNDFDKPLAKKDFEAMKKSLAENQTELRKLRRARLSKRRGETKENDDTKNVIANVARVSATVGALQARLALYDDKGNPISHTMGVQEKPNPEDVRLLIRGEFDKPAQTIKRGFPQVLCAEGVPKIESKSSGRLELARWMSSSENPLTARVMVNRIWLHMLGEGLVRSPENFGSTGLAPTHPELLDHLANQFVSNDWSVKSVIREIATSRIYRTSSDYDVDAFRKDPENLLLWRVTPKRLEGEAIRDAMLAISGKLDSDRPQGSIVARTGDALIRNGVLITSGKITDQAKEGMRAMSRGSQGNSGATIVPLEQTLNYRSVYLPIVRDNAPRSLDVMDFAESSTVVGKRETSNTPDQGLYFLNNEEVIRASEAFADRLIKETKDTTEQIKLAFLLAYGRDATTTELDAAKDFYRTYKPESNSRAGNSSLRSRFGGRRNRLRQGSNNSQSASSNGELNAAKLQVLCQGIFASAEFRFVN